MLRLQNTILEMVAKGESLERTAATLCREIEKIVPDAVCSLLTVDAAGIVHPLASPSLPETYSAALDGLRIGPNSGSCGTAAFLREPVTVTDIANDKRWATYRALALPLGLKACWSSPICDAKGRVLGTFAFYYRECRGPTAIEKQLVATCVHLCAIALERNERVMERDRLANVDGLTGLANRACFNNVLAKLSCDVPGAWALLLADLDNLKVVNDTFGHHTGDALIKQVSARLENACRPDRVFRVGGDEFAVLLQAGDGALDIEAAADRIMHCLAKPADCNGHLVQPQATIGGAVIAATDGFAESVRQNADFALYHAKETGRGGFVRYWHGIGTAITHRLAAIRDVEAALADDRVVAHYQPIIRLDTREIVGVEALCRLVTEQGDMVPASQFREATSDARVATDLTAKMLVKVAQDLGKWLDLDIAVAHVAFNVSSADFHLGQLGRQIAEAFGGHKPALERLIVEVSESAYLGQRDQIVAREIGALRKSGLRVALDDFGTGIASLTHLLTVPVDVIKIDRAFVQGVTSRGGSSAVVQGLFEIARKLGITTVAEGVETEKQAGRLAAFGCGLAQGYLFSPAVDERTITQMLSTRSNRLGLAAA